LSRSRGQPELVDAGVEDDLDLGLLLAQPAAELEAVDRGALERDVAHRHPRVLGAAGGERLLGVVGVADDLHLGAVVEERAQAEDHHAVVVDQDEGYGERGHRPPRDHASSAQGSRSAG
jgi:hypothetical protein